MGLQRIAETTARCIKGAKNPEAIWSAPVVQWSSACISWTQ